MQLRSIYIWSLGLFFLFAGCYKSQVDRLRLDILAGRLVELEAWQQQLNDEILTLQLLIDALQQNKYIVQITETAEGYTFVLNDGSMLQIYHGRAGGRGEDGAEGRVVMPVIAVRDSSDGHVYWTVNGEILRNSRDEGVRADGPKGKPGAQGETGEQGATGILPQVRIHPDTRIWEISTDGGQSWTSTGVNAQGPQGEQGEAGPQGPAGMRGDAIFAENGIEVSEEVVVFTLADRENTRLRILRYREWALVFPEGMEVAIPMGSQKKIPFSISGYGGKAVVEAAGEGGWLAEVVMEAEKEDGTYVLLTAPLLPGRASVLVWLSNGEGKCRVYTLRANATEK